MELNGRNNEPRGLVRHSCSSVLEQSCYDVSAHIVDPFEPGWLTTTGKERFLPASASPVPATGALLTLDNSATDVMVISVVAVRKSVASFGHSSGCSRPTR